MMMARRPLAGRVRRLLAHPLTPRRTYVTDAEVSSSRKYCIQQLQKGDREAHLIRRFLPPRAQPIYDALRTLNLELLRLPEMVTNPAIAQLRLKFWQESLDATFAGRPPREPICVALHAALEELRARCAPDGAAEGERAVASVRWWTMRLLRTRTAHSDNRPFPTLAALETYAENTYATMMYATLAAMPLRSAHVDHLASHIGKAAGIVAVLRGIPVLASPSPAPAQKPSPGTRAVSEQRPQALLLPLDVMADANLREEDVFRIGPSAPGLRDAVFAVATRAHDHLITAQEMFKNLQAGHDAGHEFEHGAEQEHIYAENKGEEDVANHVRNGFGVLLEAVPASEYLKALEKQNFDPFMGWTWGNALLPLWLWQAVKQQLF